MLIQNLYDKHNVYIQPEWGELCRHWKAKSNIIFVLVCVAITSIDSSWEASGRTPYRIDFSWEEAAVCRWRDGRNKQGGDDGDGDYGVGTMWE